MSRGVIGTLQMVGSVVFAIPVAFFGLLKLMEGELLVGGGFVVLAVGMFVGQELYTSPTDVGATVAQRLAGRVAKEPDDEE